MRLHLVFTALASATAIANPIVKRQSPLAGKTFSLLPLGDSITYGYGSSQGDGYRLDLENAILASGGKVDLIGSQQTGSMRVNHHEGHGGYTIDAIADVARNVSYFNPDVILLHIGTNDYNGNVDVLNAYVRLSNLLYLIYQQWPKAALMVAKIVGSENANTQSNIDQLNSHISALVDQRRGRKIGWVDMSGILGQADFYDYLHPNDSGYQKCLTGGTGDWKYFATSNGFEMGERG